MAWAVPIALWAASELKSSMDKQSAKSGDAAQAAAGAEKLRAMREGAGQVADYRKQLTPQMLQAMQNQMGAYNGARSVLSQMYGGGGGGSGPPPASQRPPTQSNIVLHDPARGLASGAGVYRPQSVLRSIASDPSGARPADRAAGGQQLVRPSPMGFRMGFGGEQDPIRGRY